VVVAPNWLPIFKELLGRNASWGSGEELSLKLGTSALFNAHKGVLDLPLLFLLSRDGEREHS